MAGVPVAWRARQGAAQAKPGRPLPGPSPQSEAAPRRRKGKVISRARAEDDPRRRADN